MPHKATPLYNTYRPNPRDIGDSALMGDIPDERTLWCLIKADDPDFNIASIEALPSIKQHSNYAVRSTNGDVLRLSLAPLGTRRVSSPEHAAMKAEVVLLRWLYDLCEKQIDADIVELQESCSTATRAKDSAAVCSVDENTETKNELLRRYLPQLIHRGPASQLEAKGYCVTRPVSGVAIQSLATALSPEETTDVDFQIGQLIRCMALFKSPNNRFGRVVDILSPIPLRHSPKSSMRGWIKPNTGYDSWSKAFQALLESVLQDVESFGITIATNSIRDQFKRFKFSLDAVTEPLLVAVDAGHGSNTLVYKSEQTSQEQTSKESQETAARDNAQTPLQDIPTNERVRSGVNKRLWRNDHRGVRVTGFEEWNNCIFGDPLMAHAFSQNTSSALWEGLKKPLEETEGTDSSQSPWNPVEDHRNASLRLLLYGFYHNVAVIAKEYNIVPRLVDIDDREMPARKRIIQILNKLRDLDDDGRPKHDQPSNSMPPAKRSKQGVSEKRTP